MTNVYDFSANNIQGKTVKLNKFKGKAMLIVNTASACEIGRASCRERV